MINHFQSLLRFKTVTPKDTQSITKPSLDKYLACANHSCKLTNTYWVFSMYQRCSGLGHTKQTKSLGQLARIFLQSLPRVSQVSLLTELSCQVLFDRESLLSCSFQQLPLSAPPHFFSPEFSPAPECPAVSPFNPDATGKSRPRCCGKLEGTWHKYLCQ